MTASFRAFAFDCPGNGKLPKILIRGAMQKSLSGSPEGEKTGVGGAAPAMSQQESDAQADNTYFSGRSTVD